MPDSVSDFDVLAALRAIAPCPTDEAARDAALAIVRALGAHSFVYLSVLPPEPPAEHDRFHYLVGCRPDWFALYCQRQWHLIDPYLAYARTHSAPIVGSALRATTPGQRALLAAAANHGYRSGLIVPTHTSRGAHKRMGLLYIGSEQPRTIGEPLLLARRVEFTALGVELLAWWSQRQRARAMRKYRLTDADLELLQWVQQGLVAREIAALRDVTTAVVYRQLEHLKDKFNVERVRHALVYADAHGLLG